MKLFEWLQNKRERLYICNPDKNTTCKKTACFRNGGPCCYTTKKECARLNKWGRPLIAFK